MKEKILYYLILPFAVVFFCIFGIVGNVYALEVGEVETRQINGGRFYHSFVNGNTGAYTSTQNSSNKYGFYDFAATKVYGIANGINGDYKNAYQFYNIPINTQNTDVYQNDLSIHFTFRYAYYKSDNYNIDNLIPYMSFNLLDFINDYDTLSGAKDLIGFNGELYDSVEIDQSLLKTNYLFFYYPRVAQSCDKNTDTSSQLYNMTVCDVTFNFPSNYFDDIPINDIWFGFWNLDNTYKDDKFGNGNLMVFNDYKFWYEEPPEPKPTPTPSPTPKVEEEQLQTSKGIFGTLKNVLTSILDLPGKIATAILDGLKTVLEPLFNIVSDLIEGLTKLIKDLFIPSDDYFQDFFDRLLDFIKKKLGFLSYPFTWLIDILQYYLNLSDTKNYVLSWNDIVVPNFNHVIIHAGTFNLSTALADSNVKMAYDIYLAFVDTIIFLAFLKLCKNKYASIVGGEKDDFEYVSVSDGYNVDTKTGEVISQRHTIRRTTRERKSG